MVVVVVVVSRMGLVAMVMPMLGTLPPPKLWGVAALAGSLGACQMRKIVGVFVWTLAMPLSSGRMKFNPG